MMVGSKPSPYANQRGRSTVNYPQKVTEKSREADSEESEDHKRRKAQYQ
jgi:hypothetical protein